MLHGQSTLDSPISALVYLLLPGLHPIPLDLFIKTLAPRLLLLLNLQELALVILSRFAVGRQLVHYGRFALAPRQAGRVELVRCLHDSADLEIGGQPLGIIFFIMPLRIEHIAELEQLQISLELGGESGTWHGEPAGTGSLGTELKMSVRSDLGCVNIDYVIT